MKKIHLFSPLCSLLLLGLTLGVLSGCDILLTDDDAASTTDSSSTI